MIWFLLIAMNIACAFFASNVAKSKGYSEDNWFMAGLFLGFFALLASVGLTEKKRG